MNNHLGPPENVPISRRRSPQLMLGVETPFIGRLEIQNVKNS